MTAPGRLWPQEPAKGSSAPGGSNGFLSAVGQREVKWIALRWHTHRLYQEGLQPLLGRDVAKRGSSYRLDELVIVDNNQDKDFWRRSRRRFEPWLPGGGMVVSWSAT